MQVAPATLPLTPAEFANALRTGHGRAIQHLDRYGSSGLEELVIDACLTCLVYDPQCEAERAPWLFSIIERTSLSAQVLHAIETTTLVPSSENHRDLDQHSAILRELAASGLSEARRLLYASLARVQEGGSVIGVEEIIALDGLSGLLHVARQFGQWMLADPDFWVDDYPLSLLEASLGAGQSQAALEREAAMDPDIARYLAGVCETRNHISASLPRPDPAAFTAAEIVAHVHKPPKDQCHWFRRWGAQASEAQREIVFAALLAADDPEHVKRLFRCFANTGTPRFEPGLLRWLEHADERLVRAAVTALAPLTHPQLRQAAEHLIARGQITNGVALLVNNLADGDFSRCAEHLRRLEDADELHHLIGEVLNLCEAHPGVEALDCLLLIYEVSPCTTCRRQAVKALMASNTAPDWVLEECMFDVDPDTRTLVGVEPGAE